MKKNNFNDFVNNFEERGSGSVALLMSYFWHSDLGRLSDFNLKNKKNVIDLIVENVSEELIVESIKNTMNIWALTSDCQLIFKNRYSPYLGKINSLKNEDVDMFFKEKGLDGADFFKRIKNFKFEKEVTIYSKKENGFIDFIDYLSDENFRKDFNYENFKKLVFKSSENKDMTPEDNLSLIISKYMAIKIFKYLNPEQKKDYLNEFNDQIVKYIDGFNGDSFKDYYGFVWTNISILNKDLLEKMKNNEDSQIVFDVYKKFIKKIKEFVESNGSKRFMGNTINSLFESLLNDSIETRLFKENDLGLFEKSNKDFVFKKIFQASMSIFDLNHFKRQYDAGGDINVKTMDIALKKILDCHNPNIYAYDSITHKISSDEKNIHFYIENNYNLNDEDYEYFCKQILNAIMHSNFISSENLTETYEIIQEQIEMRKDIVKDTCKKVIVRKF